MILTILGSVGCSLLIIEAGTTCTIVSTFLGLGIFLTAGRHGNWNHSNSIP